MPDQQPPTDEARSFWESMGIFEDLQQDNSANKPVKQTPEPLQTPESPRLMDTSGSTDSEKGTTAHHTLDPEAPNTPVAQVQTSNESGYGHLTHFPLNETEAEPNVENVFTIRTSLPMGGNDAFEELIAYDPINTADPNIAQSAPNDVSDTSGLIIGKEVVNRSTPSPIEEDDTEETMFPEVSKILHGKTGQFKFKTGITPVLVITAGPSVFISEIAHFSETPLTEDAVTPLPTLEPVAIQRSGLHPHRFSEGEIKPEKPTSSKTSGFGRRIPPATPAFKGTALPKIITAIPITTTVASEKELERLEKWHEKPLHFSAVLMGGFLFFFGIIGLYRFSQPDFTPINWQQMKLSLYGKDTGFQVESSTESARYVGGSGGRFPTRPQDWTPSDWARCGCPECTKNLNQWQAMQASLNTGKSTSTLPDSSVVISPSGKVDPLGSGSNDLYKKPQGANQTISPGGTIMY